VSSIEIGSAKAFRELLIDCQTALKSRDDYMAYAGTHRRLEALQRIIDKADFEIQMIEEDKEIQRDISNMHERLEKKLKAERDAANIVVSENLKTTKKPGLYKDPSNEDMWELSESLVWRWVNGGYWTKVPKNLEYTGPGFDAQQRERKRIAIERELATPFWFGNTILPSPDVDPVEMSKPQKKKYGFWGMV